jgi:hypothetical protein
MLTLSEKIIFFTPIIFFFLIAAVVPFYIVLKSKTKTKSWTIASLVFWGFLTVLYCIFTLSYLVGPDCVFCYLPRHLRLAAEYSVAVLIYGLIGFGLILGNRYRKGKLL